VSRAVDELRARARRALGIERLHERIDQLEAEVRALRPDGWNRSRERWLYVQPDAGLTWGQRLTGDAFIAGVTGYGGFAPHTRILEIGPGYGRLARACLDRNVPFAQYLGVDISAWNVDHLRDQFTDPRVSFTVADAESMHLDREFDLLISSLVFKHLYPTFERALHNCAAHLNSGALACFDLIEGNHSMFEDDGVTYIKGYTRPEVEEIVRRCELDLVDFTLVRHDQTHERLMTVARKS
jgi:SAM-dependent methyltransferase